MSVYHAVPSARKIFIAAMLCASAYLCTATSRSAHAQQQQQQQQEQRPKKYKLYCVNGKLEIGIRSPEDMKRARGVSACLKESFDTLLEAKKAAKLYGGVGAACSCATSGKRR